MAEDEEVGVGADDPTEALSNLKFGPTKQSFSTSNSLSQNIHILFRKSTWTHQKDKPIKHNNQKVSVNAPTGQAVAEVKQLSKGYTIDRSPVNVPGPTAGTNTNTNTKKFISTGMGGGKSSSGRDIPLTVGTDTSTTSGTTSGTTGGTTGGTDTSTTSGTTSGTTGGTTGGTDTSTTSGTTSGTTGGTTGGTDTSTTPVISGAVTSEDDASNLGDQSGMGSVSTADSYDNADGAFNISEDANAAFNVSQSLDNSTQTNGSYAGISTDAERYTHQASMRRAAPHHLKRVHQQGFKQSDMGVVQAGISNYRKSQKTSNTYKVRHYD